MSLDYHVMSYFRETKVFFFWWMGGGLKPYTKSSNRKKGKKVSSYVSSVQC